MVGEGTDTMVVAKDLSISLETPPFMIQGDRSTLVAMVHNSTNQTLTAHLELNSGGLPISGAASQDVSVLPGAPTRVDWPFQAPAVGSYSPDVTVRSGALSDGVAGSLNVFAHGAAHSTWLAGTVLNQSVNAVTVDSGCLKTDTSLTVRLTPTLTSSLQPAVDYLASYPYGSSDSTVSALVADAVFYGARQKLNLSPSVCADIKDKASHCLLRAYREQQNDGGWGWFTTDESDCWMTAYAAYGLSEARSAGLPVNSAILSSALQATATLANRERLKSSSEADVSAIALSALVLAKEGAKKSATGNLKYLVNRWAANPRSEMYIDVATAALAEQAVGAPAALEEANALMAQLWSVSRQTGAMLSWTAEYHTSAQYAGEDSPDAATTAWAMLAAEEIDPGDLRIDQAARWLVSNRDDDHWCDSDATGIAVFALSNYLQNEHELTPSYIADVSVNGRQAGRTVFNSASIGSPDTVITIPGTNLRSGGNIIEIDKTGPGRLYYAVKLSQMIAVPSPKPPPSFFVAEFSRLLHPPQPIRVGSGGFHIKRVYMRLTSRRSFFWEDTVPKPDWDFENGDSILVRLIIDSARPASRIVVDEPVPPGCRIGEVSGEYEENWNNWWDYTDVRDNDIVFFIDDLTAGSNEIDYHLVANRAGEYDVMPTSLSSMVDPTVSAEGSASKVVVDGQ